MGEFSDDENTVGAGNTVMFPVIVVKTETDCVCDNSPKSPLLQRSNSFKNNSFSNLLQVRNEAPRRNSMPQASRSYLGRSCGDLQSSGLDNEQGALLRVRSFTMTSKGIINKGDSFRRGSTASILSNSSCRTDDTSHSADLDRPRLLSDASADSNGTGSFELSFPSSYHEVLVLGADGVGKTSLIKQFTTSEYIGSADYENEDDVHTVSVYLDGDESTLEFIDQSDSQDSVELENADAYIVVFSVNDRVTFEAAIETLHNLRHIVGTDSASIILVANKIDIARQRLVTAKEAKAVAEEYQCKYTETSVTLNHQVDELLVGILQQIRLKMNPENSEEIPNNVIKTKHKKRLSISSTKNLFNKLFRKRESKSKACDNLYVT